MRQFSIFHFFFFEGVPFKQAGYVLSRATAQQTLNDLLFSPENNKIHKENFFDISITNDNTVLDAELKFLFSFTSVRKCYMMSHDVAEEVG